MTNETPERLKNVPKRGAVARFAMFWGGLLCCLVAPLIGPLPGPWSVILFGFGFGLMLRASSWVKKRYVLFKRKYPKSGEWVDFGLQRASYKRRRARAEAAEAGVPLMTAPVLRHWTQPGEQDRRRLVRSRRQERDGLMGVRPPDRPSR